MILYHNHTPEKSDGFYHPDCPVLYKQHDTITSLSDCPFPLQTDSFRVIHFGTSVDPAESKPEHGHTRRFAVVEYTKGCGHTVQERISFIEDVKTFEHYGTVFTGESYSINDWQRRIEYFRSGLCEVCALVQHSLWCYSIGETSSSLEKLLEHIRRLLDYNFGNWQEFTPWPEIERRAKATKYGSRIVAA